MLANHYRHNKSVQIVCTIGPSSESSQILNNMIKAGMSGARLNFSHGTHSKHTVILKNLRKAVQYARTAVAVIQDLSGPRIRIGEIKNGQTTLKAGSMIDVYRYPITGSRTKISVNYPSIFTNIKPGHRLFLNDGLLMLSVVKKMRTKLVCRIESGGLLKSRKGINLPDTRVNLPPLTAKDLNDIQWGLINRVDYFALSFVSSSKEIKSFRKILNRSGSRAGILAKIERKEALNNINSVIRASDGIIIARGDLAIETDLSRVPWIQKELVEKCRLAGKPVMIATQMLESMVRETHPTRAEVTDITNAVVDGADVLMLSAETAVGHDPAGAVRMMARIIKTAEQENNKRKSQRRSK